MTAPVQMRRQETASRPWMIHHFTVEQYERMGDLGVLTPEDRVELLEGIIVDKMTQHPPHSTAIDMARDALTGLLPAGWRVREQKPIRLSSSEPEPDLVVILGPATRYAHRHPLPRDIALVIEVSESSLGEDRGRKARIYARARLPIYWIVNLDDQQVEVLTDPRSGKNPAYRQRHDYRMGDSVPVLVAENILGSIPVHELMPPREQSP